jgi:hypothetical protein
MRYKAMFIAGFAVGFVAGARSGRGAYDQLVAYGRQFAEHPKVQEATSTVQAKATELTKTAAAKAPEYAKSAAASAAKVAADRLPPRFGGTNGAGKDDPAADGTPDDVGADGNLVYPAEGDGSPAANGVRFTPDTPGTR